MLSKLWDIFVGQFCNHKWKIIDDQMVDVYEAGIHHGGRYRRYYLQCEKCGDVVTRNMK